MSFDFRKGDIGFSDSSMEAYEATSSFSLQPQVRKTRPQHQRASTKRMIVIRPEKANSKWVREALTSPIEAAFKKLVEQMSIKYGPQSSLQGLIFSEEYMAVIGMGVRVVPLLLADLRTGNTPWFWALKAITREDVGKDVSAGDFRRLRDAWLAWGVAKGLL